MQTVGYWPPSGEDNNNGRTESGGKNEKRRRLVGGGIKTQWMNNNNLMDRWTVGELKDGLAADNKTAPSDKEKIVYQPCLFIF